MREGKKAIMKGLPQAKNAEKRGLEEGMREGVLLVIFAIASPGSTNGNEGRSKGPRKRF